MHQEIVIDSARCRRETHKIGCRQRKLDLLSKVRKTQFYQIHRQSAALTDFAGFEMPLFYRGIIREHLAVRNAVGIFDISHMGRVAIKGADSEKFLNYVISNDVAKLSTDAALYTVMCTPQGGIIDDFVVYRRDINDFLAVFNAGNREKDYSWLREHSTGYDVDVEQISDNVAMVAVQGPAATKTLQKISTADLSMMERFKCGTSKLEGTEVYLSRTGYTGEDGFEVFIWDAPITKPDKAIALWNAILEAGNSLGIEQCGLGARDTLRLEAGLCLYGNDIDENTTPLEAGLGFVVKLQKESFIGKENLQKQKAEGVKRKRIGVVTLEQGVPRAGFEIFNEKNEKIGQLTSGTFSPLLKCGVGMGYVDSAQAQEENTIFVKIRERKVKARIASFPLYDKDRYGSKRKAASGQ